MLKGTFSTIDYNTNGNDPLTSFSCAPQTDFLFDEAHSPLLDYNVAGRLSQFYGMVTRSGYTTEVLSSGPLTSALLSGVKTLVIYTPQADYTPDQGNRSICSKWR